MRAGHSYRPSHAAPRTAFAGMAAEPAWRGLIEIVRGLAAAHGPGAVAALLDARAVCAKLTFPVEGADAALCAKAALDIAAAYPKAGEDARGHHRALLEACAAYLAVRLDQAEAARIAAQAARYGRDD